MNLDSLRPVLSNTIPFFSIRYKEIGSPFKAHRVPRLDLPQVCEQLVAKGTKFEKLVFNETPPDGHVILQADVCVTEAGWTLFYSRKKNMRQREALAHDGRQATGLTALSILTTALWPSDIDDLRTIMDQYPGHVVEFTTFNVAVGTIPHRNTVIWEVRADY